MKNKKKRSVTLIEMMIVMFLIAMIIGVVAYNYSGSLDEGRAFKTKAAIDKIETILHLADAEGGNDVVSKWETYVNSSPLVQKGSDLTKDGWGEKFQVDKSEDQIVVSSSRLNKYVQDHPGSMFKARK